MRVHGLRLNCSHRLNLVPKLFIAYTAQTPCIHLRKAVQCQANDEIDLLYLKRRRPLYSVHGGWLLRARYNV